MITRLFNCPHPYLKPRDKRSQFRGKMSNPIVSN